MKEKITKNDWYEEVEGHDDEDNARWYELWQLDDDGEREILVRRNVTGVADTFYGAIKFGGADPKKPVFLTLEGDGGRTVYELTMTAG